MVHVYSIFAKNSINACTAAIATAWVVLRKKKKERRALAKALRNMQLGPGGRGGTLHPRVPRARYPGFRGKEARRLKPEKTQWHFNYVVHAAEAADPESVIGKEFRAKFRIPFSMFEEILQATRDSGKFANDMLVTSGPKPHPLSMKVMAALRR
jgi:hypothetical protein